MSTPSTATATNPPHQLHYGYPHHHHHPSYPAAGAGYDTSAAFINNTSILNNAHYAYPGNRPASTNGSRGTAASSSKQPQHLPTMAASQASSSVQGPSKSQRAPNWREFYKNGLPKEVIIIDDDSPPLAAPSKVYEQQTSKRAPMADDAGGRHVNKKRKTAASGNETGFSAHAPSLLVQAAPNSGTTSATTVSIDRTASAVNTTAPTSLGSHYSQNGLSNEPYVDAQAVGQKRKRTTRKTVADEAKRLELERQGDAYSNYHPPPKPPIKAKDVYVQVVPTHAHMKNQKVDDEDGHYMVRPDTTLTDRYEISRLLGQGTFGKVVEAWDRRRQVKCAIKIIRSVQKYRDASRIELRVLATLAANDKENRNKCIHLRDCFDYRNHICIVTDLLGQSVFDFLKSNAFVPFPNSHIQSFARQLFTSVAFLHDLNLIHTDLKPENILLVDSSYQTFTYNRQIPSSSTTVARSSRHRRVLLDTEIRLIDFGSATFEDEYHSSVVSTRHYRAPEIILGLGWSYPCDIWSIGCILVEFFTGDALFQTHDNLEHLAMMESVCGGKIESKLIRQVNHSGRGHGANPASKFFRRQLLDYPNNETTKASKKYVKAMKRLHDIIPETTRFNKLFLDLLRRIFLYDPKARITAKDALRHPWFKETTVDDGSEALRLRLESEQKRRNLGSY
ncbi:MAG: dual specificity protein kinase kns1 [Peltula sp. TS41687]|nr:MAG: dual specificity protein kinase kns1 [Peltula sp. TS41687]